MPNRADRKKLADKLRKLEERMKPATVYSSNKWNGTDMASYTRSQVQNWIKSLEGAEGPLNNRFMMVSNDIWKEVK
jgi:hypothetical protein